MLEFEGVRIGFAVTGSFCTFDTAFRAAEQLRDMGAELIPIMSSHAAEIDTRFGKAADQRARFEEICGRKIIRSIADAEPIGPKGMTDIMLVAPCTGNTIAKLAHSITDTPVTMAVKSHLRGARPVLLAVSTNDALAGSAKNLGILLNTRHYFAVPFRQDAPTAKPASLVADFNRLPEAIDAALHGIQLQPVLA